MPRRPSLKASLRSLLGPDAAGARQSIAALAVSLLASFVAGFTLGSIEATLEALPGLMVLVPAAIGMRGTIFGALGSRLSTAIHTGTFGVSRRPDTVVGQNVLASITISLATALALAFMAKGVATAFGLRNTISIPDLVVISVMAAILSSAVVLVLTVALAAGSVRFGWDLDNVMAPIVTAAGDMVTLPALYLATLLVGVSIITPSLAAALGVVSVAVLVLAVRSGLPLLKRIVAESLPVVLVGGLLGLIAGVSIESRLESFVTYPALLVLIPPFLASAGSLGGILSSRLSSGLHLGVIEPSLVPARRARRDIALTFGLALPVFALCSVVADIGAIVGGLNTPGPLAMVTVALLGGAMATVFVVLIAYYGTLGAWRFGVDPDTYGIPIVTSSVDLVGAFALIVAIVLVGLT
jgi:mgtE-like transporter